jgi:hypothetical protein
MKKQFITLILTTLISIGAFAQSPSVERFFDAYDGVDGLTFMELKGNFLNMMLEDEDIAAGDKFRGLRLIATKDEGYRARVSPTDISRLMRDMEREGFEEMMTVRDGSAKVDIFGKKVNSKTASDITLVVNDNGKFVLISLWGEFDFKKASRMIHDIHVDGDLH